MKYIAKILLGTFFLAGVFISCVEDKGNYDYSWVQEMELRLPDLPASNTIIIANGSLLKINPAFYNKGTDTPVEVDFNNYDFTWDALPSDKFYTSDRVHLSNEYNLNANVFMPVSSEYHTVTLQAVNKETTQVYRTMFRLRTTATYESAYFFLTEDASRNVEMDIYGWTPDGEVLMIKNYFASIGYTETSGGANGITFDKYYNRMYFSTGETFSWLATPGFEYDKENKIENILIPTTQRTFSAMTRLGGTSADPIARNIIFFAPDGSLNNFGNGRMLFSNFANVNGEVAVIAPMVAGYKAQQSSVYWSLTHKRLCWASLYSVGMSKPSFGLTLIDDGIGKALAECLYLGGSTDREMIAIVKDVDGDYWRVDLYSELVNGGFVNTYVAKVSNNSPRKLDGTASLGNIAHWINAHSKGYIYAVTDNNLYTYVEAQSGGIADPGWTKAVITDSEKTPVTISDPVSFVHFDNDGLDYMYVFTYSEAKGGTLYRLRTRAVGTDIELVDKITGLGNVKKMCYWWG